MYLSNIFLFISACGEYYSECKAPRFELNKHNFIPVYYSSSCTSVILKMWSVI